MQGTKTTDIEPLFLRGFHDNFTRNFRAKKKKKNYFLFFYIYIYIYIYIFFLINMHLYCNGDIGDTLALQ